MPVKFPYPHIVLLVMDDQRSDTIHALGNRHIITPHLDGLVRDGVSFLSAQGQGSAIPPVCIPARAQLFTARHQFSLEHEGRTIPEQHSSLGEVLRTAGYAAYGVGKWHNDRVSFNRNFEAGTRLFFDGMHEQWHTPVQPYDPQCLYNKAESPETPSFSTDVFTEGALELIEKHCSSEDPRPFFLYLALTSPHDPRDAPPEYRKLYREEDLEPLPAFAAEHPFDNGAMNIRDEYLAAHPRTAQEGKRHLADYYAMITSHDAAIGRIINDLKSRGLYEDSIIVFTSDHGLSLGSHGLFGKQNLYEESLKVPLIIKAPGLQGGNIIHEPVYHFGLFPTLCTLLGLPTPDSVEIPGFMPYLTGASCDKKPLYSRYGSSMRSLKQYPYKLIEYHVNGVRKSQLFDLSHDPWEERNICQDRAFETELHSMRALMLKIKNQYGDRDELFWKGWHD